MKAEDLLNLSPVRDVQDWPEVLPVVEAAGAWIGRAARQLEDWVVVPESTESFVSETYVRPPGSSRSFYFRPAADSGPVFSDVRDGGVLAIKGMEPVVPGFDASLHDLRRPCYSPHNIAEHFVLEEGKIPGCLTLQESLAEAERAAAVHASHLAVYGSVARMPIPLAILRHSEETVGRVRDELETLLSAAAFRAVRDKLDDGLGVYVYYYPALPVRVTHVDFLLKGRAFSHRALELLMLCDPEVAVHGWVRGFVRLLYLGFVPGSLASLHSGVCCQPQNSCLDGGFVDLDSITPISELPDDTAVHAALQFSTEELVRTVRTLLAGADDHARPGADRVRVDLHHLNQYVLALIQDAIETERRPGAELDSRVIAHFRPARTLEELVPRLASYFAPASPRTAEAWQDFGSYGRAMVREAQAGLRGDPDQVRADRMRADRIRADRIRADLAGAEQEAMDEPPRRRDGTE